MLVGAGKRFRGRAGHCPDRNSGQIQMNDFTPVSVLPGEMMIDASASLLLVRLAPSAVLGADA